MKHELTTENIHSFIENHEAHIASASGGWYKRLTVTLSMIFKVYHRDNLIESTNSIERAITVYNSL